MEIDFGYGKHSTFAIIYLVFPTSTDALGDFKDAVPMVIGLRSKRSVPSLPQPALILSGAQAGVGFTEVVFVSGNVLVATVLAGQGSSSGAALALATLALQHLRAVERVAR